MEYILRILQLNSMDIQSGTADFIGLSKKNEEIRAIGRLYMPREKQSWHVTGEMKEGVFHCAKAERTVWDDLESQDILIDKCGITKDAAKQVTELLGKDVYQYHLEKDTEKRLREIRGIGPKRAETIADFIKGVNIENEVLRKTLPTKINYQSILTMLRKEGPAAAAKLSDNPYTLMMYGAAFIPVDTLALEQGVDPWDAQRIIAAIHEMLRRLQQNGYTRMEYELFLRSASVITNRDEDGETQIPQELIEMHLPECKAAYVWKDGDKQYISPSRLYHYEKTIAENAMRIILSARAISVSLPSKTKFNREQKDALEQFMRGGIMILTGGPGTGKTTVIGGMVEMAEAAKKTVLLCAPTGRAASRMSEVSNTEAKTIHKAMNLKWFMGDVETQELEYDIIIADEMSMCDTELLYLFLKAVRSGTTLVLSGDYNQLPSVGPGQIFRDMIESNAFPVVRLKHIMRQKDGSGIVDASRKIISGQMPESGNGFEVVTENEDILSKLTDNDVQYMVPIKKGKCGTFAINHLVQRRRKLPLPQILINGMWFRRGDKVIMNENRYDIGFMNGDVGEIIAIAGNVLDIQFANKVIRIEAADLGGMLPAYALTVHKSQGAECDEAVIVLPRDAKSMASRELLYTAVTRAKDKVTIIEEQGMMKRFIDAEERGFRDTGLRYQIEKTFRGY